MCQLHTFTLICPYFENDSFMIRVFILRLFYIYLRVATRYHRNSLFFFVFFTVVTVFAIGCPVGSGASLINRGLNRHRDISSCQFDN